MVKALIDIKEKHNKKLNLIKAQHGFNDKSVTIAYIIDHFKELEQNAAPFLPMKNNDSWLLAEDIPDIDFFFSQIWLSLFVNEFEQPGGKAYSKTLGVYKGYKLKFYYGDKNADDVARHLTKRLIEEKGFMEQVNQNIIQTADKLSEFCKTIPISKLSVMSNEDIWDIYKTQDRLHTEYYQWGWIPPAADMFHSRLTDGLKKILEPFCKDVEDLNKKFMILTQPQEKSLIQIQREEFLHLAKIIQEDKKQHELFEELFKNFNEKEASPLGYKTHTLQYEELLEKKSSELISKMDQEIFRKINVHYKKYHFINRMWVGKSSSFDYYLKELVKLIGNNADVASTLEQEEKTFVKSKKEQDETIKELALSNEIQKLFTGFGNFMITKIYRRYAQLYAVYIMEYVQQEIANRFALSLVQVRFLLPEEVKKALLYGSVDKEELEKRTKFCVYYAEKGKDVVYTDKQAQQLAEEAEITDIDYTTELRGQIGCMGEATGIVKHIIRPEDMRKMNKGDILVSIATDPDIVPAMMKAGAIVTEQGGVTSHAAIVSRELDIPCIIGTKIATKVLHEGDLVEVDAKNGIVKVLKRNQEIN